jgi:hypothetical protein
MRTRLGVVLGLVCLSATVAQAELFVCFDAARPLGSQFTFGQSDPLRVTDPNCTVVTKASGQTAAQLALIQSTIRGASAPKYLKVANGLAVAMTTGEQDAVDADLASKAAAAQVFRDEVANQEYCSVQTLEAVSTAIATRTTNRKADLATLHDTNAATIAALSGAVTLAMLKAVAQGLNDEIQTVGNQLLDNDAFLLEKAVRCLIAIKKGAR